MLFGKNNPFHLSKMKNPWKIVLCMLFYFGRSEKIAVEDNETILTKVKKIFDTDSNGAVHAKPNKTSENLKTFGYEIAHLNDTHAEVRNTFERKRF